MSYKSKELKEQRGVLAAKMAELVTTAKKSESGCLNTEQRSEFDKLDAEQQKLLDQIASHERMEKFESALLEETRSTPSISIKNYAKSDSSKEFALWAKAKAGLLSRDEEAQSPDLDLRSDRYVAKHSPKAQQKMLEHRSAQSAYTANLGAEFVPTTLADFVSATQTFIFDVRSIARNITTEGMGPFVIPTSDDSANMAVLIAEATADAVLAVPTDKKTLSAYAYTSKIVQIPFELLNSGLIDIQQWFGQELGMRFGRGRANALCNGSGSSQPTGYKGAAGAGVTLASASAPTYAELLSALYAVPIFYRANACWVVSDSFAQAVRGMVDGDGRPLWTPGGYPTIAAGAPDTLLGKPMYVDPYLDAMGAINHTVAVIGDFSQFLVRNVNPPYEVATSKERYFEQRVLALVGFGWMDSCLLQSAALKKIVTPAS